MDLSYVLQLTISGFLMGGVYSLIALGLSLIFGVMKVINFAHGAMLVWGMYFSYTILKVTGLDPFFSFFVSAAGLFVMGYVIQRTVVNRIMPFHEAMQVIAMVGTMMVLENLAQLIWGPDPQSPQTKYSLSTLWLGKVMIDLPRLFAFLIAILIAALVFVFLKYTDLGKSIRASADNRTGALLVGTDVNKVYAVCFGVGAACVGAAGSLLVPLIPISPHTGFPFKLTSFCIVILGGMGSLPGAMIGGLIIGVAESLGTIFIPSSLKQVISFSIMILILLLRPQGLFGGKG
ncbi:MAG: branched-chain amino acid ABC transporter permease [Thermodesulfobacteriota bacterium]|nr:branched-chain amino acid ABC transporter permease [Thermodesulfobacteriota bacterium]